MYLPGIPEFISEEESVCQQNGSTLHQMDIKAQQIQLRQCAQNRPLLNAMDGRTSDRQGALAALTILIKMAPLSMPAARSSARCTSVHPSSCVGHITVSHQQLPHSHACIMTAQKAVCPAV